MISRLVAPLLALVALAGLCGPVGASAAERDRQHGITGSLAAQRGEPAVARVPHRSVLPAVASQVRLTGDETRTQIVIDLTRAVEFRAFALADPYRVILDAEEIAFDVPRDTGTRGQGLVQAYRYGLFAPGKSRMVIDLTGPALIERATLTEARDQAPPRLVIDLRRTDTEAFRRAQQDRITSNLARRGDRETSGPRGSTRLHAPDGPPVVVLDPGHGGIDSGAIAETGDMEKSIVLDFARVLRDRLNETGRYRVVMTRDRDVFVPLPERVRLAREARGALFVSIHADSISGAEGSARGVTVYTLSDRASDADSARLADRENKADAIAGLDLSEEPNDVADILIDLTRRETRLFSQNFARTLAGEMRHATRMHRLPIRSAGFQVLRAHDIPSVLVELGFVSSRSDLEFLTSAIWRERTAGTMVKAIDAFFSARTIAGTADRR